MWFNYYVEKVFSFDKGFLFRHIWPKIRDLSIAHPVICAGEIGC